jgi:ABC-type thiamine transport system ATPase subunit
MADITVTNMPRNGVSLDDIKALATAFTAGPDKFLNTGRELVFCINDDVGAKTVTVTSQPDDLERTQDEVINVAAGEISIAGPFPPRGWSETSGADISKVALTPSDTTSFSVLVVRLPTI